RRLFSLRTPVSFAYRANPVPDGVVTTQDLRRGMNAMKRRAGGPRNWSGPGLRLGPLLAGGLAAVEMRHQEGQSFVDQVEGQLLAIADCAAVGHRGRADNQPRE